MTSQAREPGPGHCFSRASSALIDNPLAYIYEDHRQEREICERLDCLAGCAVPDEDLAISALSFLCNVLPLHVEDEEQDLFPLVRRRCEPEDDIGRAIERLSSAHRQARVDVSDVVAVLEDLGRAGRELTDDERSILQQYAANTRRHLMLENAVILPFARLRLTKTDLETLRLRMMQRRGLGRPGQPVRA